MQAGEAEGAAAAQRGTARGLQEVARGQSVHVAALETEAAVREDHVASLQDAVVQHCARTQVGVVGLWSRGERPVRWWHS